MNEAVCLLIYAGAVVVLGAAGLPRLTRSGRSPRLGVAAWLGAGLSVLVAVTWSAGRAVVLSESWPVRLAAAVGLAALGARTAWSLVSVIRDGRALRRRHRDGLRLLGAPDVDLNALVVDAPQPMAYCLPGRDSLIVITSGARAALTTTQLRAVLAHERSHLTGRHHLAQAAAYTLARVLPRLPLFAGIGRHVPVLLEMRADDLAAQAHGRGAVARALGAMSRTATPAGSVGAGGPTVHIRVRRLRRPIPAWRRRVTATATALVAALVAIGPFLAVIDPWCEYLHL
jgi:Zn-dependent protease with chaperone function